MARNIIIILASLSIVIWSLYVLKKRKIFSFTTKNFALGLLLLWFLTTFLFNIPLILSPLTPAINGTVIDAVTKRPIATCNIKAYWQFESGTPAGRHFETYHQFITKTDEKGKFQVPRYIKVLGLYGFFPIIVSRYGGIKIVAYTHGFKFVYGGVAPYSSMPTIIEPSQPAAVSEVIKMEKSHPSYLMDDLYNLKEIFRTENIPPGPTAEDKKYLLEEYNYYYERIGSIFKNSKTKEIESVLFVLANAFKEFDHKERAIEVYQRLKKEFPESATFVDQELDQLKR